MGKKLLHLAYCDIAATVISLFCGIMNFNTFETFFCVTLTLQFVFIFLFCIGLIFYIKHEKPDKKLLLAFLVILLIITVLRLCSRILMEKGNSHLTNPFIYLIYFSELFSMAVALYAFGNGKKIFFLMRRRPIGQVIAVLVLFLLCIPLLIGVVGGPLISVIQFLLELSGVWLTLLNTGIFFYQYQNGTQQMNGTDK